MTKRVLAILLALVLPASAAAQQQRTARMNALVDSLLEQMTIDEKVGQLTQWSDAQAPTGNLGAQGNLADLRAGKVGSFLNVVDVANTCRIQREAVEHTRLHIPLLFGYDVIHGYRTIFPVPLAEAASWNPAGVERAARIAADEASAHGLHWTFAPMVDIARDARWGRIVEGSGEDPYLASVLAAARVRGFQGNDLTAPNTLLATAKHFVAYGAAEAGRDYNVADISERTLREIYLPPFHAAVRAGVGSVMASFNEVAGTPMHANGRLLTDLLRGQWDFDGFVVSDWTGIHELIKHGVAADGAEAARRALLAGVDMDMVGNDFLHSLPGLLERTAVTQAQIDEAVRRVLRAKYRLGLFDNPYRNCDTTRERTATLSAENRRFAGTHARESIVLLKNERALLPLATTVRRIAVIGALAADSASPLGPWAGKGDPKDAITILDALKRRLPKARIDYARGADPASDDTSGFRNAVAIARLADVVVLVVGENRDMSGEAHSRADLGLPGAQLELAKRIRAANRNVIVVLMNGRPLAIPWLAEHVPAIVESWFLGVEMGTAVSGVLVGDYNPSGKLPVTFPRAVGQVPIYYNHKNTGRPADPKDMYTSKYIDVSWTPQFTFGYGLSYTTFSYSEPRVQVTGTVTDTVSVTVTVTVTNAGVRAGEEVVQLYVRDEVASITRPVQQLRGFRKILLQPGQAQSVEFTLGPEDFGFYDDQMRWVVEPGTFTVMVGGSSVDTKQAHFTVR